MLKFNSLILEPVFKSASGNKKLLQLTKYIWVLSSAPKTEYFEILNLGIKAFELYEGLREAKNFRDLWEVTHNQSNAELLCKVAFKITYISTSLMILTNTQPYLQSVLKGMNLCSWLLMVEDSKDKLLKNENRQPVEVTKLKYDLVTSTLEVVYNTSSIIFSGLNECGIASTFYLAARKFLTLTPIILNVTAKVAGLTSIIYKTHLTQA